jgi:NCS1 family nucleobase:cation symporter-1
MSHVQLQAQAIPAGSHDTATKAPGEESLAPQQTRIMGRPSYFLAWFGGCVSIGTFAMGSSVVGTLNLLQATLAIAIGCFVIGIALAINSAAGYKYGIPFTGLRQCRGQHTAADNHPVVHRLRPGHHPCAQQRGAADLCA